MFTYKVRVIIYKVCVTIYKAYIGYSNQACGEYLNEELSDMIQSDIEIKVDKRVIRGIVTRPPTEQKKYPMADNGQIGRAHV